MKSKYLKKIFIFLTLFLCFGWVLHSQQSNCPPYQLSLDKIGLVEINPYKLWGSVVFQSQLIGNHYEVKIDWNTLVNNTGSNYNFTTEELKEMMYKSVIFTILQFGCNLTQATQFIFYEESDCLNTKTCWIKLDNTTQILCKDDAWTGPLPEWIQQNNQYYFKKSEIINCGKSCCQLIYTISCEMGTNGLHPVIISKTKQQMPGTQCPPTEEVDCLTGEIYQCHSTCQ
jgi:hypothetical protein